MKIHFFERKFNENQISIEKLFGVLQRELIRKGVEIDVFKNPFPLHRMLSAMIYFKKNQGQINHITGDIHWASLLLDKNRTILTIHDLVGLQNLSGIKRRIYFELWLRRPVKRLKYITVISKKTKLEIVKYLPSAENKIIIIPNCLTTEIAPDILQHYKELINILVVGTRENKNLESVIQAIKNLNIKLTIVGKLSLNQTASLYENKINFDNFENVSDDQLVRLYDDNDILCFPSLYEGFGLPILEAQARNCTVITSDFSPMKDVAGGAAILVNPICVSEIRSAVQKLSTDYTLRNDLIAKGKANVKKYLPEVIANQYMELYNNILQKK